MSTCMHVLDASEAEVGFTENGLSVSNVNLASLLPTFRTRTVLLDGCLTGAKEKLISSGKSRSALEPVATTGTTNFSRSVMQVSCTV